MSYPSSYNITTNINGSIPYLECDKVAVKVLETDTIKLETIPMAIKSHVLYYNTVNGEITYGLNTGGGGNITDPLILNEFIALNKFTGGNINVINGNVSNNLKVGNLEIVGGVIGDIEMLGMNINNCGDLNVNYINAVDVSTNTINSPLSNILFFSNLNLQNRNITNINNLSSGKLNLTNLSNTVLGNVLYYNPVNGTVSFGVAPSGGGGNITSPLNIDVINANTININSVLDLNNNNIIDVNALSCQSLNNTGLIDVNTGLGLNSNDIININKVQTDFIEGFNGNIQTISNMDMNNNILSNINTLSTQRLSAVSGNIQTISNMDMNQRIISNVSNLFVQTLNYVSLNPPVSSGAQSKLFFNRKTAILLNGTINTSNSLNFTNGTSPTDWEVLKAVDFSVAGNTITYTGSTTKDFYVQTSFAMVIAATGITVGFQLSKTGTPLSQARFGLLAANGQWDYQDYNYVSLSNGDTLTLQYSATNASGSLGATSQAGLTSSTTKPIQIYITEI